MNALAGEIGVSTADLNVGQTAYTETTVTAEMMEAFAQLTGN